MAKKKLTPKQEAFVRWYCSEECYGNGTESARRAGYKGNDNTLAQVGKENLRKPQVADAVARGLEQASSGAAVTIESVLRDVARIGKKAEEAGKHSAALKAEELKGKFLAMWTERIEHTSSMGDVTMEELVGVIHEVMAKLDPEDARHFTKVFEGNAAKVSPLHSADGTQTAH